MRAQDFRDSGLSIDDAVALLTASFGDDVGTSRKLRSELMREMAETPEVAVARFVAALDSLAVLATAIIEWQALGLKEDPKGIVQRFALRDREVRPR
jgi:hypothetical protein